MFLTHARIESVKGLPDWLQSQPVVRALYHDGIRFPTSITIFTGENGAGKSTLIEALAVSLGANPSGGSRNARFNSRIGAETPVSPLHQSLITTRRRNPTDVFFLRGETFFDLTHYYSTLPRDPYAGLISRSHGQSLMELLRGRLGSRGLYFLDEPEDGLSVFAQLELLGNLWHLADRGAQIVLSTHSPILLGIPEATLYSLEDDSIRETSFSRCEAVTAHREFLADPVGTASYLVGED
ncbi:AAA family ATPase [Corynebacterium lubricantis]|uniref:AAA family ATPase n=1 Tax=Corynebacterium lubricantis TaxID=541095 RepID=UPI00037989C7|nr:AAA family ATPase [Corynebacterium lubricantis]